MNHFVWNKHYLPTYTLVSMNHNIVNSKLFISGEKKNYNRKIVKYRGSVSTIHKCGSEDPDPRQNEMDLQRRL